MPNRLGARLIVPRPAQLARLRGPASGLGQPPGQHRLLLLRARSAAYKVRSQASLWASCSASSVKAWPVWQR